MVMVMVLGLVSFFLHIVMVLALVNAIRSPHCDGPGNHTGMVMVMVLVLVVLHGHGHCHGLRLGHGHITWS